METSHNNQTAVEPNNKNKKSSWKFKLVIFLLLIILGLGAYSYFWYQGVQKNALEASNVIEAALKYEQLQTAILTEYERCQQLVLKTEGNFTDFEYCKKFIDWVDIQNN